MGVGNRGGDSAAQYISIALDSMHKENEIAIAADNNAVAKLAEANYARQNEIAGQEKMMRAALSAAADAAQAKLGAAIAERTAVLKGRELDIMEGAEGRDEAEIAYRDALSKYNAAVEQRQKKVDEFNADTEAYSATGGPQEKKALLQIAMASINASNDHEKIMADYDEQEADLVETLSKAWQQVEPELTAKENAELVGAKSITAGADDKTEGVKTSDSGKTERFNEFLVSQIADGKIISDDMYGLLTGDYNALTPNGRTIVDNYKAAYGLSDKDLDKKTLKEMGIKGMGDWYIEKKIDTLWSDSRTFVKDAAKVFKALNGDQGDGPINRDKTDKGREREWRFTGMAPKKEVLQNVINDSSSRKELIDNLAREISNGANSENSSYRDDVNAVGIQGLNRNAVARGNIVGYTEAGNIIIKALSKDREKYMLVEATPTETGGMVIKGLTTQVFKPLDSQVRFAVYAASRLADMYEYIMIKNTAPNNEGSRGPMNSAKKAAKNSGGVAVFVSTSKSYLEKLGNGDFSGDSRKVLKEVNGIGDGFAKSIGNLAEKAQLMNAEIVHGRSQAENVYELNTKVAALAKDGIMESRTTYETKHRDYLMWEKSPGNEGKSYERFLNTIKDLDTVPAHKKKD